MFVKCIFIWIIISCNNKNIRVKYFVSIFSESCGVMLESQTWPPKVQSSFSCAKTRPSSFGASSSGRASLHEILGNRPNSNHKCKRTARYFDRFCKEFITSAGARDCCYAATELKWVRYFKFCIFITTDHVTQCYFSVTVFALIIVKRVGFLLLHFPQNWMLTKRILQNKQIDINIISLN